MSTAGEILVYQNPINPITNPLTSPITRSRVGRIAWSLLCHPVKSREFPAKQERLVTPGELMQYRF